MHVFRNAPHLDHLRHVLSIQTCAAHVHPSRVAAAMLAHKGAVTMLVAAPSCAWLLTPEPPARRLAIDFCAGRLNLA
jgi:hypothetical protein